MTIAILVAAAVGIADLAIVAVCAVAAGRADERDECARELELGERHRAGTLRRPPVC